MLRFAPGKGVPSAIKLMTETIKAVSSSAANDAATFLSSPSSSTAAEIASDNTNMNTKNNNNGSNPSQKKKGKAKSTASSPAPAPAAAFSPPPTPQPLPMPKTPADVGIITIVGTVMEPRLSHKKGFPIWQCTLAQTHVGRGGNGGATVDTQLIDVRCVGRWAESIEGDGIVSEGDRIRKGSIVAVTGKLLHRPKYIASTTSYDHRSEILVSDMLGSITLL